MFSSTTYSDEDIQGEIKLLHEEFEYIFDPHSVTSIRMALSSANTVPTVALATASPEKFSNIIAPLIDEYTEQDIDTNEEYLTLKNDKFSVSEAIKAHFT